MTISLAKAPPEFPAAPGGRGWALYRLIGLLVGETGTGKELVAHLIHTLFSVTHNRKFVILDCTTIVPELSGSELSGDEVARSRAPSPPRWRVRHG